MNNDTKQLGNSLLDPQTIALMEKYGSAPFLDITAPVETIRRNFDKFYEEIGTPFENVEKVDNRNIPGAGGEIPVRIYHPANLTSEMLPITLFYHGGGMVFGSLESYDTMCRRLCNKSGSIIISVDYRLAPENKFPKGIEDSYAALQWASENASSIHGDPARLAVCGESGGGNIAAVVCQLAHQRKGPKLTFQVLIYPALGTRGNCESIELFSKGYFFEITPLQWFYEQYLEDLSIADDPMISPILADDFSGVPPTFVITAGYDMLRDSGEEYAKLLQQADVPAEFHRYETTIHGFLCMAGVIDAGRDAIDECGEKLKKAFQKAPEP